MWLISIPQLALFTLLLGSNSRYANKCICNMHQTLLKSMFSSMAISSIANDVSHKTRQFVVSMVSYHQVPHLSWNHGFSLQLSIKLHQEKERKSRNSRCYYTPPQSSSSADAWSELLSATLTGVSATCLRLSHKHSRDRSNRDQTHANLTGGRRFG